MHVQSNKVNCTQVHLYCNHANSGSYVEYGLALGLGLVLVFRFGLG